MMRRNCHPDDPLMIYKYFTNWIHIVLGSAQNYRIWMMEIRVRSDSLDVSCSMPCNIKTNFWSIGGFYEIFNLVTSKEVSCLLDHVLKLQCTKSWLQGPWDSPVEQTPCLKSLKRSYCLISIKHNWSFKHIHRVQAFGCLGRWSFGQVYIVFDINKIHLHSKPYSPCTSIRMPWSLGFWAGG